jgi:hypothetical protein
LLTGTSKTLTKRSKTLTKRSKTLTFAVVNAANRTV